MKLISFKTLLGKSFLAASVLSLHGCLATTNLLTDGSLDTETKKVAYKIAENAQQKCVTYKYNQSTNQKLSGNMTMRNLPEIKRLFRSETGWWKAEMLVTSVWDNVYYNENSKSMVCGQKTWDSYSDTKSFSFVEIGANVKSLYALTASSQVMQEAPKKIISPIESYTSSHANESSTDDFLTKIVTTSSSKNIENGCIIPVKVEFHPSLASGESFKLYANTQLLAEIRVIKGRLKEFNYHGKMSSSGELIAQCEGCKSKGFFTTVKNGCSTESTLYGSGEAKVKIQDNELKALFDGLIPDSLLLLTSDNLDLIIYPTIHTANNPYIGVKSSPQIYSKACIITQNKNEQLISKSCVY